MPWFLMMLLVALIPLVFLVLYAGGKLVRAVVHYFGWSLRRARWVIFGALTTLNLLPPVSFAVFWIFGRGAMSVFAGESLWIDILLTYPFWTTLVVLVQLSVVFLLWDIGGFVARRLSLTTPETWRRRSHAVTAWAWTLIAVYSVATIIVETSHARVVEVVIPLPPAAAKLDGFRILQISDVQGDGRTTEGKIRRFIDQARALDPDLILNGGDIVTNGEDYIVSTARLLGTMTAPYGHIAAVGDHDIFSNKKMVVQALRDNGIVVADDTTLDIEARGTRIGLTMMTMTYRQRPRLSTVDSLVLATSAPFKVMLVHQPNRELIRRAADAGVNLVLAGHTHGGGIAFGIPGIKVYSPATFESPYVSGLYRLDQTWINVTNGLGFTLAPIRFQAPLEMTLIVLRAGPASAAQRTPGT